MKHVVYLAAMYNEFMKDLNNSEGYMNIYDMPVEWQEDYNTTVKVWKTIKNYIIRIYKLKKSFRQEDQARAEKN